MEGADSTEGGEVYEIERTVAGEERTFFVWSKDAAEEEGIPYVHWTFAHEGAYALTDDGYVGLCLKRQRYDDEARQRVKYFFTFAFARKWLTRKMNGQVVGNPQLNFLEFHEKEAYYMTRPQSWAEAEARRTRARRAVKLYAQLFLAGEGELTEKEWEHIANAYRPGQERKVATVKRLFKSEEIQDMAAQEIQKLLGSEGIDPREVVRRYNRIFEKAIGEKQLSTAFRVNRRIDELLGLEDRGGASYDGPGGDGAIEEADFEMIEDDLEEAENLEQARQKELVAPESTNGTSSTTEDDEDHDSDERRDV